MEVTFSKQYQKFAVTRVDVLFRVDAPRKDKETGFVLMKNYRNTWDVVREGGFEAMSFEQPADSGYRFIAFGTLNFASDMSLREAKTYISKALNSKRIETIDETCGTVKTPDFKKYKALRFLGTYKDFEPQEVKS